MRAEQRRARRYPHRVAHASAKCHAIIAVDPRQGQPARSPASCRRMRWTRMDIEATKALIRATRSQIVINVGSAFLNMSVLARLHRNRRRLYGHRHPRGSGQECAKRRRGTATTSGSAARPAKEAGVTAMLGVGFDPGVVNAYAALARRQLFRPHRFDRHHRHQCRQPRPLLRHQFRSGNQFPRVHRPASGRGRTASGRRTRCSRSQGLGRLPVVGKQHHLPDRARRNPFAVAEPGRAQHPLLDGFRRALHQRLHGAEEPRPAVRAAGDDRRRPGSGAARRWSRRCCPTPPRWRPAIPARPASATWSRATRTASRARCFIYNVCRPRREAFAEVGSQAHLLYRRRAAGGGGHADRRRHMGRRRDGQRRRAAIRSPSSR